MWLPWQWCICRSKYGCFCLSLQVTYLHTKSEGGLILFISNFVSLSWRIALNPLTYIAIRAENFLFKWVNSGHFCLLNNTSPPHRGRGIYWARRWVHYLPINMSSFPSSPNIVNSPSVISLMSLYNCKTTKIQKLDQTSCVFLYMRSSFVHKTHCFCPQSLTSF